MGIEIRRPCRLLGLLALLLLSTFLGRGGEPGPRGASRVLRSRPANAAPGSDRALAGRRGPSAELPADLASGIRRSIQEREYRPSRQKLDSKGRPMEPRLHFANRAQGMRAYFGPEGLEVLPRVPQEDPSRVRFRTLGWDRGEGVAALPPRAPEIAGAEIVFRHATGTEAYHNSPAGLEQVFRVHERPSGEGPLIVRVRVEGDVLDATERSGNLEFRLRDGSRLGYSNLVVTDARERRIPARMAFAGGEIALRVEDRGAEYPLLVDPLLFNLEWSVQGNVGGAAAAIEPRLGDVVAGVGDLNGDGFDDIAAVASQYDNGQESEGAVFVWYGSGSGPSTANAAGVGTRRAPNPDADWAMETDTPGGGNLLSVASAGNVNGDAYGDLVIGIPNYPGPGGGSGCAFVYHGSVSGLPTADGGAGLKAAVSPDASWAVEGLVIASLGIGVAAAGDVDGDGFGDLLVGSLDSAFVYHGSASGLPLAEGAPGLAGETSPDADWAVASNLSFGTFAGAGDVNGDGFDDILIGAPDYDDGSFSLEGAAFVWYGSASGLPVADAGSGLAGTPSPDASWAVESNLAGSRFGASVCGAGDLNEDGYGDIAVGAVQYDDGTFSFEGAAFVWYGSASGLPVADAGSGLAGTPSPDASWAVESNVAGSEFGLSVASAGDVDGDGDDELAVAGRGFSSFTGAVFVYLGSSGGLSVADGSGTTATTPTPDADWAAEGPSAGTSFGSSTASAGDVNGDGWDDLLIGAANWLRGQYGEGAVFAYFGSATGLPTADTADAALAAGPIPDASWAAEGLEATPARLGLTLARGGKVNNDAYDDLVVGAPTFDNGQYHEGAVFVFYGSASGFPTANPSSSGLLILSPDPDWSCEADLELLQLGTAVAGGGDADGDGYDDVAVSAIGNTGSGLGAVFVFHGSATGLSVADGGGGLSGLTNPDASWSVKVDVVLFAGAVGDSVAWAGDINGDGYHDLAVGSTFLGDLTAIESISAVFVYHGSAAGLPIVDAAGGLAGGTTPDASWAVRAPDPIALFGCAVAGGDMNGDDYDDLVVGARDYASVVSPEGAVFVYYGSASGLDTTDGAGGPAGWTNPDAGWAVESKEGFSELGAAVSTGDVNGDGYHDLIMGQPRRVLGINEEGAVLVFHGSATGLPMADAAGFGLIDASSPDASWGARGRQVGAEFGRGVAGGDLNDDGFADLVVGAPAFDNGQLDEGAVFAYLGSAGGLSTTELSDVGLDLPTPDPYVATDSGVVSARLGFSVVILSGDGDAFGEVAAGAPGFTSGQAGEGAVFVFGLDFSPPTLGTVIDGPDVADIDFQASTSSISASWSGFSDPQTGVAEYEWAIGTAAAPTSIQDFTSVGTATNGTAGGLTLTAGTTVVVTVRAINGDGVVSAGVSSDGVVIEPSPPLPGTVLDGPSWSADLDTQTDTGRIAAHWSGFDDPESAIAGYEWAIGITAGGTEVQPFLSVGSATSALASNLFLIEGETYYVTVRATNGAGGEILATSDGVMVQAAASGGTTNQITNIKKEESRCGLLGVEAALIVLGLLAVRRRRR